MEKNFYSANGTLFTLFSEKTGTFYTRKYNCPSSPYSSMTECGIKWLGSVRTYRENGKLKKAEFSVLFCIGWLSTLLTKLGKGLLWLLMALAYAVCWLACKFWVCLKWLGKKAWKLLRLLGVFFAALLAWLVAKFRRPKTGKEETEPQERKPMNWKWLRWALPLAALFLIIWFWPSPKSVEPVLTSVNKVVNVMPRQTAIARGYLDTEDNLLGCKFIFNEKAQKYLEGKENNLSTFESVSDASWVAQVDNLLAPEVKEQLSDDQIAVITLVAMRNGQYGFKNSDFLRLVNDGNFDEAADAIWLHNADGRRMKLQNEALQYTWCLWALGKGYVSFEELWNAPTRAYKNLDVNSIYADGKRVWKPEFKEIMLGKGCHNTPVKDFGFFEGRNVNAESTVDVYTIPDESLWNKICRFVYPAKKGLRSLFGVKA